jgi:hypothetical protein
VESVEQSGPGTNRRSFVLKGAAVGAGAIVAGRGLAHPSSASASGQITEGDVSRSTKPHHSETVLRATAVRPEVGP